MMFVKFICVEGRCQVLSVKTQDRRQIQPAPADNLEVGEVRLPELVRGRGLVLERICCENASNNDPV